MQAAQGANPATGDSNLPKPKPAEVAKAKKEDRTLEKDGNVLSLDDKNPKGAVEIQEELDADDEDSIASPSTRKRAARPRRDT